MSHQQPDAIVRGGRIANRSAKGGRSYARVRGLVQYIAFGRYEDQPSFVDGADRNQKMKQRGGWLDHNGKAVDFRVTGVPNEVVRDFCRTLKNTGCGYYPNSTFVHLDVRESSAFWIDYSKPGEPPG